MTNSGVAYHVEQFDLDNGHTLTFAVHETEGTSYVIDGTNHAPERPVPANR